MNSQSLKDAISMAEKAVAIAKVVGDGVLEPNQSKLLDAVAAYIDIVSDSVMQQIDIKDVTMEQLNAEEVVIIANDLKAQANAPD